MNSVKAYLLESYDELMSKVTWPSFNEVQLYAVMVFIASLLIAGAVFVMDFAFGVQDTKYWKGVLGFIYGLWS